MRIAPNPWRVRIFLAEKGVTVPFEQVDTFRGDTRTLEFLAKIPSVLFQCSNWTTAFASRSRSLFAAISKGSIRIHL